MTTPHGPDAGRPSDTDPNLSAVTAIQHAAEQGWFSMAEAEALIDRFRTATDRRPGDERA